MKTPFLETGFLITEEDYVHMALENKKYNTPKENRFIVRILGIIAVFCGICAYFVIRGNIYQLICWLLLVAIGLFGLFYYDVINPSMVRKQAKNFYNFNKNIIESKTVKFYDDEIKIFSENHKLSIPKKYIYRIAESKHTVFIYFDKNEFCFIPVRIFSETQFAQFREFAKSMGTDKYKKI